MHPPLVSNTEFYLRHYRYTEWRFTTFLNVVTVILQKPLNILFDYHEAQAFWSRIKPLTDKITDKQVPLTSSLIFFGYISHKNDPLAPNVSNLLNWLLSMCRLAIHKSAVEFRLRKDTIHPYTILKIKTQSHLTQQYKLCRLQHTTYYFPHVWGIFAKLWWK